MKKKALLKDTLREIKNTFGRFMAITLIVLIGEGFFVGLRATAPTMRKTADTYFNRSNLYDFTLSCDDGFVGDDADEVEEIKGVADVQQGYSADVTVKSGESNRTVRLLSWNKKQKINKPTLIQGRLPKKDNECVICTTDDLNFDMSVGDDLEINKKIGELETRYILDRRVYEVVGVVALPDYFSYTYGSSSVGNGEIAAIALIPEDNFKLSDYTNMYVTLECHQNGVSCFDERYDRIRDKVEDRIEDAGDWTVLDREDAVINYSSYTDNIDRVNKIANVFPIFFLLVAVLVCTTTMSRMVDEERLQIGTYKAFGYRRRQIAFKYNVYAMTTCIIGCVLGLAIFIPIIPRVMANAYSMLYEFPIFMIEIPWNMIVMSVIVVISAFIAVTYFTCGKTIREITADLMRPKAPKASKEVFIENCDFIWNRLSFFRKLTIRNLLKYRGRLVMTIIGISGCMALVMVGFGMIDALEPIIDRQYGEISHHDVAFYLDENYSEEDAEDLLDEINDDDRIAMSTLATEEECKAVNKSAHATVDEARISVMSDTDNYEDFITLRDPDTHKKFELTDDGVIITNKMAKTLGIGKGDTVEIVYDDEHYKLKVTAVAECYVTHYIYMTPTLYEETFDKEPEYKYIFSLADGKLGNTKKFTEKWLDKADEVFLVYITKDARRELEELISSLSIVSMIMIICAGLLAFIVLYNLTSINISERIREIATIKVLGFRYKELYSYVLRENVVMCLGGIVFGAVGGYFLTTYIVNAIEVSSVAFSHSIDCSTYLYAACITLGFTLLANLAMRRKIRKVSMVESLKAVE